MRSKVHILKIHYLWTYTYLMYIIAKHEDVVSIQKAKIGRLGLVTIILGGVSGGCEGTFFHLVIALRL